MRDLAVRTRTGLVARTAHASLIEPRIHVDLAYLCGLEGQAKALSFLPHQPVRSVLNSRNALRFGRWGLTFEELHNHLPEDEVRMIDWAVTAGPTNRGRAK